MWHPIATAPKDYTRIIVAGGNLSPFTVRWDRRAHDRKRADCRVIEPGWVHDRSGEPLNKYDEKIIEMWTNVPTA